MASEVAITKWHFPIDFCPGIFACNNDPTPGTPIYNAKTPTGLQAQLILCSSVGILCFLLFCVLRVRWSSMYSPRLRMKKHAPDQLPPSMFGWILPLLRTPHSVVLEKVGLDAVVMLQFLLMGAKLFGLCGFFSTIVLYPISLMGGDLLNSTDPTLIDSLITLNSTSPLPSQPAKGSQSFLWVYLFFTYFFCLATFYFTFLNYRDYIRIRREFMLRIAKTLPARTVLVTGIPPSLRTDRKLAEYFEQLGIGVVDSVHIIRHVSRLLDLIKERAEHLRHLESAYARFWGNPCHDVLYDPDALVAEAEQDQSLHALDWRAHATSDDELPTHRLTYRRRGRRAREAGTPGRPTTRDGFMSCLGKQVDAVEYHTQKFNDIDDMVIRARKFSKFLPTSVGFVTFEDAVTATVASQVLIDSTPFRLRAQLAPEPRDVLWENIAMHGRERMIRKVMIMGILLFLVFFWLIPISYISALTNENALRNYFPWLLELASKSKILRQIVQGFLPTLAVVIFMAILPLLFNGLSVIEGFQTRSEAEESTFSKHFFFLLFNVLLVFTVSSALFKTLTDILEDPTQLANILATRLPSVAPFFVNYTVLQSMMLLPIQLLQIGPIVMQLFYRVFLCRTPRDYAEVLAPRMYNYGWGYPVPVFMFVVLLVYSTIAPLILVFGTLYFCLAYLVVKYQLLYVYFHQYEVAGRMWPMVFTRIIVGLLIFELTSAGLFLLNGAYPLSALCVPLIILTVLFKLGMDSAYHSSTRNMPLHLLTQKLGPASTIDSVAPVPPSSDLQPSLSERSTNQPTLGPEGPNKAVIKRRRTVLDDDDYEAASRRHTDFKQPPMTLLDGILNTGMKRYGHPAFFGVLPQLWLPVKSRSATAREGKSGAVAHEAIPIASSSYGTNERGNIEQANEQQPLLGATPRQPRNSIPIQTRSSELQEGIPESNGETDDEDENGTYYHHPERRMSRSLVSRSYGATSQTQ